MPDIEPSEENDYQAGSTTTFNRERWNAVMLSIATRLKARELLEASFEALISGGTQAALDVISANVAPQLEDLIEQINALEEQLEDIIGGGTAPNALQLGGQNPSYYLALANATGMLPVAQVTGVDALIAAAVAALVNSSPPTLDTLKELSDALGGDANFAANVAAAIGNRLRIDAAQGLSSGQIAQALANLGGTAAGIALLQAATVTAQRAALGLGNLAVKSTTDSLTLTDGAKVEVQGDATFGEPHIDLHYTGVKRGGWYMGSDGTLRYKDQGGGVHFAIAGDGAVTTQQLGDLSTRIESRAAAYASTRVESIRLAYIGDGPVNNTTYSDYAVGAVVTGGYALNNGGGVTLMGFRARALQFLIGGSWYTASSP